MITIHRITPSDDLAEVADLVKGIEWGMDNELVDFSESALAEIARDSNYLLLYAYVDDRVAGLALAMKLLKPSGEHWLYVDEIDTHPDFHRQGIAKLLMNELFRYANGWGLEEVWLGTEPDNKAANALYSSLNPTEREEFVGYTFRL